jgi:hypothetical protein
MLSAAQKFFIENLASNRMATFLTTQASITLE